MTSVSFLARSVARRSLYKAAVSRSVLVGASPRLLNGVAGSSVRFSSYFTPAHEYVKVDGDVATIGITDFAQAQLGDIVFVDLPEVGDEFEKGDSFGSVESVKAASDVYAPVGGTIKERNEKLVDEPGSVNQEAEGDAWFIKLEMKDKGDLEGLMDAAAYKEHCEKEAH